MLFGMGNSYRKFHNQILCTMQGNFVLIIRYIQPFSITNCHKINFEVAQLS